ncbi:MAG: TIGR04290 family methyltransferase, partial [Armatimonadota bacterium]|nr:TIGR04290 family methyltransferase [Armatimonadota bacterium]
MSLESVRQGIAELSPWFHNLHLPNGLMTAPDHPLGDFPARKWARIK